MKIALCQINSTVGSFSSNIGLIEKHYNDAINKGADLVVFPRWLLLAILLRIYYGRKILL